MQNSDIGTINAIIDPFKILEINKHYLLLRLAIQKTIKSLLLFLAYSIESSTFSTTTAKLWSFRCSSPTNVTLPLCLLCFGHHFCFLCLLFILCLLNSLLNFTAAQEKTQDIWLINIKCQHLAFLKNRWYFKLRTITYRRAASLAASRTSGFSDLFFWITSNVAPTMDLE